LVTFVSQIDRTIGVDTAARRYIRHMEQPESTYETGDYDFEIWEDTTISNLVLATLNVFPHRSRMVNLRNHTQELMVRVSSYRISWKTSQMNVVTLIIGLMSAPRLSRRNLEQTILFRALMDERRAPSYFVSVWLRSRCFQLSLLEAVEPRKATLFQDVERLCVRWAGLSLLNPCQAFR